MKWYFCSLSDFSKLITVAIIIACKDEVVTGIAMSMHLRRFRLNYKSNIDESPSLCFGNRLIWLHLFQLEVIVVCIYAPFTIIYALVNNWSF